MLSYFWVSGEGTIRSTAHRFFKDGVCGGSVTLDKAAAVYFRANIEGNG